MTSVVSQKRKEAGPIPKLILDPVTSGRCVLFLGAAIHAPPPKDAPYTYPDERRPLLVTELVRRLAEHCEFCRKFPDEPPTLQRVALFADTPEGGGRRELVRCLQEHLEDEKLPSPAVRALAELPFRYVVTTNFDTLFEQALKDAGKHPQVFSYRKDMKQPTEEVLEDPTDERPLVFKIHGDFANPEHIVVTDEDYITFVQRMGERDDNHHPLPLTVRLAIRRWPTLFIGYSLRDYNLRLLFRTLRWGVDESKFPLSYSVDRGPDPLILQVWQHERNLVRFVITDLWDFVPSLYRAISGKDMPGWGEGT